ncbi:MAG: ABC transporter ATP-binding protein [Candidatus Gracilibacteria bacterium]|nr:ABC transporter ATP-binding protein [Candidatus Gracilibacteria bacterium]
MIKLENIKKQYKMGENIVEVLKGVDLEIAAGDFVSIMGPSGSGKSTLMNIIGMLDIATSGKYTFNNMEITGKKEDDLSKIRGKNIGFIFQSYNLISRMPVIKQVMLPLAYQGIAKNKREKMALDALDKVGLADKKNNKPNELSGGQQQRVSIARALAINPNMILADEPTGALDTKTGEEIMLLLTKLNQEGTTIVLITHEHEIDRYAKKHILIKDGLIVK